MQFIPHFLTIRQNTFIISCMFENLNVVAIVVAIGCAMAVIGAIIRCIINK